MNCVIDYCRFHLGTASDSSAFTFWFFFTSFLSIYQRLSDDIVNWLQFGRRLNRAGRVYYFTFSLVLCFTVFGLGLGRFSLTLWWWTWWLIVQLIHSKSCCYWWPIKRAAKPLQFWALPRCIFHIYIYIYKYFFAYKLFWWIAFQTELNVLSFPS